MTAVTPENSTEGRKALNATLPLVGSTFGYVSFGAFSREKDASVLAGTAAAAVALDDSEDQKASATCNAAIGAWNNARPDASSILAEQSKKGSKSDAGDKNTEPSNPPEGEKKDTQKDAAHGGAPP